MEDKEINNFKELIKHGFYFDGDKVQWSFIDGYEPPMTKAFKRKLIKLIKDDN